MLQRAILDDKGHETRNTRSRAPSDPEAVRQSDAPRRSDAPQGAKPPRQRRTRGPLKGLTRIAGHRVFVPALAIWGAAIGGMSVMVLPAYTIIRIQMIAGLSAIGASAQYVFAALAAFIGAAVCWGVAVGLRTWLSPNNGKASVVSAAARRVRPIDPANELGSDSLDAPIDDMPFGFAGDEQDFGDFDFEPDAPLTPEFEPSPPIEPQATSEAPTQPAEPAPPPAPRSAIDRIKHRKNPVWEKPITREEAGLPPLPETHDNLGDTPEPNPAPSALDEPEFTPVLGLTEPVAPLDLGDFSEIGPDAGEMEPSALNSPGPAAHLPTQAQAQPAKSATKDAIALLREVPPAELSLMQMVERFAAALHDFQNAAHHRNADARARNLSTGFSPERDQALAEALKALSLFTQRGFDEQGNVPTQAGSTRPSSRFGAQFSGQEKPSPATPSDSDTQQASIISDTERELREALARLTDLRGAA